MESLIGRLLYFPLKLLSKNETVLAVITWVSVIGSILGILGWISTYIVIYFTNFQFGIQSDLTFGILTAFTGTFIYMFLSRFVTDEREDPCDGCLWDLHGLLLVFGGNGLLISLYFYRLYFGLHETGNNGMDQLIILILAMALVVPILDVAIQYYIKNAWGIVAWRYEVSQKRLKEQASTSESGLE